MEVDGVGAANSVSMGTIEGVVLPLAAAPLVRASDAFTAVPVLRRVRSDAKGTRQESSESDSTWSSGAGRSVSESCGSLGAAESNVDGLSAGMSILDELSGERLSLRFRTLHHTSSLNSAKNQKGEQNRR